MADIKAFYEVSTSANGVFMKDGSFLFLSNKSGMNQVWRGRVGEEPVQVTNLPDRVWSLKAAPNGEDALLTMDHGGDEQEQIFLLRKDASEPVNLTNNPKARNQLGGMTPDGKTVVFASNARSAAHFDLCTIDVETGKWTTVLENEDSYNWPAKLSPNGRYLLYNKLKGLSDNHFWMFDLETGEAKDVGTPGAYAAYKAPAFLHDSTGFYLCTDEDAEFQYLAYYDIASGKMTKVYAPEWDVEALALSPDDRYLAMFINEDGYSTLKIYDRKRDLFLNIPSAPKGVSDYWGMSWAPEGYKLLFTLTSGTMPENLWLLDLDAQSVQRVTTSAMEGIDPDELVDAELCHYTSFDGLTVPYWYYKAPGKQEGPRPVLIDIHGGPEGQERPMFAALTEYLVSQGMNIIAPNVRGSVGYGKTYTHLDDVEKRLDSVHDIDALVKHLGETGIADKDRIAVMGGSYGGFMTLSCVARYPELWAAGVDVVGMTNLVTFLENTSEYRRAHRESEYGTLAHDRETLYNVSPIAKVGDIKAPLMVIHGANDPRVPVTEADMIVENVKSRGIEVSYLRYEDEGHGLAKRKNQLDCYPQVVAFLKKHLRMED